MSTTAVLVSPPPLSSPSTPDSALKPNPHPYAIKTTHTALLSRSNSSGHNTPSKYFYHPSTGTSSRSPTKHAHGYRGHRYSASLTGKLPFPLPSPLPSPTHPQRSESEDDALLRRPRADTLPTYLADGNHTSSTEPKEDLPLNPKIWTPSQLSVYLTTALRVRSGERPPERVAHDIASWVRREGVGGRAFLRWTDEDLKLLGVNMLWRSALLAAARNLRQNILRGRIWGNPASDIEQGQDQEREQGDVPFASPLYASSSSSLDLPLNGEDAESGSRHRPTRRLRMGTKTNGRVRGMVDKWERESAGSRNSDHGCHRSGSESDSGSELGEGEVVAVAEEDVDRCNAASEPVLSPDKGIASVLVEDDEPSIEDLLAAEPSPSAPRDGSWGARAWEELDSGVTMRHIEQHDTVVPRRDASSGNSANMGSPAIFGTRSKPGGASSSSRRIRATATREDSRVARRMAADIFTEPSNTISTPTFAEAEVQADVPPENELEEEVAVAALEAELEAKEFALESEARSTRALLEEFKRRLEDVEGRVSAMEVEWHLKEAAHVSQQSQAQGVSTPEHDAVETLPKTTSVTPERDDAVAEVPTDDRQVEGHSAAEKGSADRGIPDAEGHVVRHTIVDIGPTNVSDLPSYVFLVGLGICAVVLQVVLKRVGSRSLKP